jgi:hypothetical protein
MQPASAECGPIFQQLQDGDTLFVHCRLERRAWSTSNVETTICTTNGPLKSISPCTGSPHRNHGTAFACEPPVTFQRWHTEERGCPNPMSVLQRPPCRASCRFLAYRAFNSAAEFICCCSCTAFVHNIYQSIFTRDIPDDGQEPNRPR